MAFACNYEHCSRDESTQRWEKRYIKLFELDCNSQTIGRLEIFEARQDKMPLPSSTLLLGFELLEDFEKHIDDYFYITLKHENQVKSVFRVGLPIGKLSRELLSLVART